VNLLNPVVAKIALWVLLLGWISWIAFQWLREVLATPAQTAVTQSRPLLDLDAAVATAAAAPLFGDAARPDASHTAVPSMPNVRLKGVFASGDGPAAAIVNVGREDEFVLLNKELGPGVTLQAVHPTHIVIIRNGAKERVELEALKSDATRSKGGAAAGTRLSHGHARPPDAAPDSAPAPPPAGEAAPVTPDVQPTSPLAPPMQQSQRTPDAPSQAQLLHRAASIPTSRRA
jgi:type II secretory pathway component PulC